MSRKKRVFLIVLDSLGIGEAPDAADYGDTGSNTLRTVTTHPACVIPHMKALGLCSIDGWESAGWEGEPAGAYGRMMEASAGKDTTTGHWELAGIISRQPLPTFPDGFPDAVVCEFEKLTGRKVLCNRPYSGTQVILDYGREQMETGGLIVYTSADSVFQVAAHESSIPVQTLYEYCEAARGMLIGEHCVGRVIARPFTGSYPHFERTARRHDYSLHPPSDTMLTLLKQAGLSVIAIGKINDIFAGDGITESVRTESNEDGMQRLLSYMDRDFEGLCFLNLVDFDMKYGHRNDVEGYARALSEFDAYLPEVLSRMQSEDLLILTADHGCDPGTASTDHSREYVPVLITGNPVKHAVNLKTRNTFADIAQTVLHYFQVASMEEGISMWPEIRRCI